MGSFAFLLHLQQLGADDDEAFRDEQLPDEANALAADLVEEHARLADVLQRGRRERQAVSEADVGNSASSLNSSFSLNKLKCKLFSKGDCSLLATLSTIPHDANGLEILGAPVGSDEFVAGVASSKVMKAVEFCERVAATVDDP